MIRTLLLLISLMIATSIISYAQAKSGAIFVIVHVDAMPQYTSSATALLNSLMHDSLKDNGVRSFKILQRMGGPNHFAIEEEWADQQSYDAFSSAAHTRHFREQIQPMLGSPFDERLHTEVGQ